MVNETVWVVTEDVVDGPGVCGLEVFSTRAAAEAHVQRIADEFGADYVSDYVEITDHRVREE